MAYVLLPWISVRTRKCTEVSAFCSVICRSSVNKQVKSSSISFFFKSLFAKLKFQKIYKTSYLSKFIRIVFRTLLSENSKSSLKFQKIYVFIHLHYVLKLIAILPLRFYINREAVYVKNDSPNHRHLKLLSAIA